MSDEMKTCEFTCREMTIREEIMELDIDEITKKRILDKVEWAENKSKENDNYLMNCHREIRRLERAIIEMATSLGCEKYNIRTGVSDF